MRLGLQEAAHDAERAEQLPVAEKQPRNDRVVRAPARLDAPADGEAGAAVLEHDTGSRRDDTRAERPEEALDEGHGRPVAVHGAEVDRAAGRLRDVRSRGAPPLRKRARLEETAHVRAVAHVRERVLEGEPHALDLRGEARLAERE